jgi:hypothetical protein
MSILGKVAFVGIGVGVASLALAWTIGGRDLRHSIADNDFSWRSCSAGTVAAAGPERRLPWSGDDSISLALSVPVHLLPGTGNDVVLRGAPETIAHLEFKGGRLRADCRNLPGVQTVTIELPSRALQKVRLSGSATATIGPVDQPNLALTVNGSGSVQVNGKIERVAVTIHGSGDIRLNEVTMKRLTARVAGSGNLEGGPKEEADIAIAGSGNVRLLSRPATLNTKIAGSGRITQPPVEAADRK